MRLVWSVAKTSATQARLAGFYPYGRAMMLFAFENRNLRASVGRHCRHVIHVASVVCFAFVSLVLVVVASTVCCRRGGLPL